jgi:hypothetical protein
MQAYKAVNPCSDLVETTVLCNECAAKANLTEADVILDVEIGLEDHCESCGKLYIQDQGYDTAQQGEGGIPAKQQQAFAYFMQYLQEMFGRYTRECSMAQRALTLGQLALGVEVANQIDGESVLDLGMLLAVAVADEVEFDFLGNENAEVAAFNAHHLHYISHYVFNAGLLIGLATAAGIVPNEMEIEKDEGQEIVEALEEWLKSMLEEDDE